RIADRDRRAVDPAAWAAGRPGRWLGPEGGSAGTAAPGMRVRDLAVTDRDLATGYRPSGTALAGHCTLGARDDIVRRRAAGAGEGPGDRGAIYGQRAAAPRDRAAAAPVAADAVRSLLAVMGLRVPAASLPARADVASDA